MRFCSQAPEKEREKRMERKGKRGDKIGKGEEGCDFSRQLGRIYIFTQ